jgi:hypothetical protein
MLRFLLLVSVYLYHLLSPQVPQKTGGGLDPNGSTAPPPTHSSMTGGGLEPDGRG